MQVKAKNYYPCNLKTNLNMILKLVVVCERSLILSR